MALIDMFLTVTSWHHSLQRAARSYFALRARRGARHGAAGKSGTAQPLAGLLPVLSSSNKRDLRRAMAEMERGYGAGREDTRERKDRAWRVAQDRQPIQQRGDDS